MPGLASFDFPVEGGSLAADLARNGHRVFVIDARGYGGSSRPGEDGGSDRQPLTNSHEVVRDLVAVDAAVTGRYRCAAGRAARLGDRRALGGNVCRASSRPRQPPRTLQQPLRCDRRPSDAWLGR
ncbi:alpha/beta fold hydrolase [Rhizobium leguminosarum]|uniref:alpha/beta fold hydrolase n=1 Tax=Rhizobium leguminosarum TaxID=384 RepID=UPI0032B256A8